MLRVVFFFFFLVLFFPLILRICFFLCPCWSSKACTLKSSAVGSPYLRPAISSVLLSKPLCGFRAHGLFLLLCPDLPWATRVIQKKVALGHAGHTLPLIPIINWFLISGNDSGKWACQIFASSPYEPFSFGHWTHTLSCRWSMMSWLGDTEPNLDLAEL